MSPSARTRYKEEKEEFMKDNYQDTLFEFGFQTDVPFTVERTLVYQEKMGWKPWYASFLIHIFLDVLFLGWIQRLFLERKTFEVKYQITKYLWE